MVDEELQKWVYTCPDCLSEFLRPEALQKHTKKVHKKVVSACRQCPCLFESLNALFLHARQVHISRQNKGVCEHQCPFCNYQTNNGGLMKHHMRSHTNYKPHKCEICHKQFTQKSNMKTHFNRHLSTYRVECQLCDKSFNSYDIYLSHLETREHFFGEILSNVKVNFQCLVCNQSFDNSDETFNHLYNCDVLNPRNVKCLNCGDILEYHLESLVNHVDKHRQELLCPYCEGISIFNDKTAFNYHITNKHNKKVSRRSVCRYCESLFENEELRNQHIKAMHPDAKNRHQFVTNGRIRCGVDLCGFLTNSEIQIQKHLKIHYGNFDSDLFYKKQNRQIPADTLQSEPIKKRGRPRLCNSFEMNSSSSISQSVSMTETCETRKRGRPRKSEHPNNEQSITNVPKRGRPRKYKIEEVDTPEFFNNVIGEIEYNLDDLDCTFPSNTSADPVQFGNFLKTECTNIETIYA